MKTPKIIIHGGCGKLESKTVKYAKYRKSLKRVLEKTRQILDEGSPAIEIAVFAIKLLEDDPIFNAGTGSKIQSDGVVRMTAALIDSKCGIFSGVMNVEDVKNPIEVANFLQSEAHNVLAGQPALTFAREKGISYYDPVTELRLQEYQSGKAGNSGTVGVVVLDRKGVLASATSTGGIGGEMPGRVSDSATVAGTYCSRECGVSCTGIGEHIVHLSVASRMVTMAEDGRSLEKAKNLLINKANSKKLRFGFIALDREGNWCFGQTRKVKTLYAVYDGHKIDVF
jgi:L-asparaginase